MPVVILVCYFLVTTSRSKSACQYSSLNLKLTAKNNHFELNFELFDSDVVHQKNHAGCIKLFGKQAPLCKGGNPDNFYGFFFFFNFSKDQSGTLYIFRYSILLCFAQVLVILILAFLFIAI